MRPRVLGIIFIYVQTFPNHKRLTFLSSNFFFFFRLEGLKTHLALWLFNTLNIHTTVEFCTSYITAVNNIYYFGIFVQLFCSPFKWLAVVHSIM